MVTLDGEGARKEEPQEDPALWEACGKRRADCSGEALLYCCEGGSEETSSEPDKEHRFWVQQEAWKPPEGPRPGRAHLLCLCLRVETGCYTSSLCDERPLPFRHRP